MTATLARTPEQDARRRSTVAWVVGLATFGLIFDGYDLVVYGAVVSTFLRDPTQIGEVTPQLAGALGSYALVGVLVGALLAGTIADIVGRRTVMLIAYAWFSIAMAITALTSSATTFGLMRFVTGLGVGALVATTGAIVSEFAPPGKKNLCNAITYSGVPLGSLLAALLAIILLGSIGWRGMFWIGALPLVTLLPLAFFKMPESPAWLLSRGRVEEARAVAERTGVPLVEAAAAPTPATGDAAATRKAAATSSGGRAGFAGLFGPGNAFPAILLGFMSVTGLMLVYALNTWLPELMRRVGYDTKGSLSFLLVLNGGAVIGALIGSRVADRFGPKPVVASCFLIGAISIAVLTFNLPLGLLLLFVAIVGLGTSGTQTLLFGFVANYFRTNVRGAAVAWCAGFGRLGGVGGPLLGGFLIGAGFALNSIFYILAGLALFGMVLTLLVPVRRTHELHRTPIEPSGSVAAQDVTPAGRRPTP
jgi:MFS transporter, AAHS family, benzoate transport protein